MAIAHGEVIQMISEHSSFEPPADRDVSVWRYMDLAKFLWMLQKNALFFARADQLGDPYEVAREIRVKSEAVMRQAGVA